MLIILSMLYHTRLFLPMVFNSKLKYLFYIHFINYFFTVIEEILFLKYIQYFLYVFSLLHLNNIYSLLPLTFIFLSLYFMIILLFSSLISLFIILIDLNCEKFTWKLFIHAIYLRRNHFLFDINLRFHINL